MKKKTSDPALKHGLAYAVLALANEQIISNQSLTEFGVAASLTPVMMKATEMMFKPLQIGGALLVPLIPELYEVFQNPPDVMDMASYALGSAFAYVGIQKHRSSNDRLRDKSDLEYSL